MPQQALVAVLVAGAFAYSAWTLMPAAWRSGLRRRLGLKTAVASAGCSGCGGGCGGGSGGGCAAPATAAPAAAVITLHRRPAQPAAAPRPDCGSNTPSA